MIEFTRKDTICSFEFFVENFEFRNATYNFYTLLGIFMKEINSDIVECYPKSVEQEKVKKIIKQTIFTHFKKIDFNVFYNREEIENIVFRKNKGTN